MAGAAQPFAACARERAEEPFVVDRQVLERLTRKVLQEYTRFVFAIEVAEQK